MKILALGNKITKEQLALVYKLIESAFVELKPEITVVDIHTTKVPVERYDLGLGFGNPAYSSFKDLANSYSLPPLSKLNKLDSNKESRASTFKLLQELAVTYKESLLHKTIAVTSKEFSQLLSSDLDNLFNSKQYIEGQLSTGESIRVWAQEPLDNTADINLSLNELKTIKFLIEKLGLEKINIKAKAKLGKAN